MRKNAVLMTVLTVSLVFALMLVAMPAVGAGPSISQDVSFTGPDRTPDEYGVYGGYGSGYGMYCLSVTITISGLAPPNMDPEIITKEGWSSGGFEVLFFSGSNVDDPDLEGYKITLETVEEDSDGGTYTYKRCRIPQETGQWKIVVTAWGPSSYKVEAISINETAGPYDVVPISPPYPVVVVLTPEQQWKWFKSCVDRHPNCQIMSYDDFLKKWEDEGFPIGWDYEYTGCPGADFSQDGELGTFCRGEEVVCCPPDEIACMVLLGYYQLCIYNPEPEVCREYHSLILRNFCMDGGDAEPKEDSDGDGVPDDVDQCPSTPAGVAVDDKGCPIDLWIEDIKIIQTVEDAEQSLVASKPTMVRVFVDGSINSDKEEEVKTKLKLILGDSEELEKDVTIKEQRWYTHRDKKTGKNSINFFIPRLKNFATEGNHTVKAIINPDNNPPESNRDNNSKIKSCYVRTPKSKFEVQFIILNVGDWDIMDAAKDKSYFASATANSNFLRAVYPVSYSSYIPHIYWDEYDPGIAITQWIFLKLSRKAAASKNIDKIVGMYPKDWMSGIAGASKGLGWDGVIVEEGTGHYFVAAHEIMHTYGKYCGKNEDYLVHSPYGSLADDGWWVEKKDDGCRVNIGTDRKEIYEDFGYLLYFSYMGDANPYSWWTNKSDYEFLYSKFVSSTTTSSHYPIVKASDSPGKLILLSGLIWSNGSVTIDPIYSGDFLDPEEEEPSSSKYYLEFYHDATLLKTYRFDTLEFTDSPEIQDGFVVTVEMPENTTAIYIKRNDGTQIATISPSGNAPSVELTYPNGGEFLTGDVDVTWNAEDVDGDSLTYLLYFSDDSGSTWGTIAMDIEGSSYQWDSSAYPGSDSCMLKIVVSDGFNSAEDTTDSVFSLADKTPFVAILSPENNSIFGKEEEIYFDGIAYDPQGDILNYSYFNWTSDIDGDIGTGQTISLSNLSLGTHEIKLSVKNSAGLTGTSESNFVTVSTNPPPTADFYSNVTWGKAPLTVQFNDTSSQDPTSWSWDFGDNSASTEQNPSHTYTTAGRYTVSLTATNAAGSDTETKKDYIIVEPPLPEAIFDTGTGTYPSIFGKHNGTITTNQTITVNKLYTYPCVGTGGHTEYARVWNSSWGGVEAHGNGYKGDWHNITFDNSFTLVANATYSYTIRTGSYPQIIHADSKAVAGGTITCTSFMDTNGNEYVDWIPAIRLGGKVHTIEYLFILNMEGSHHRVP